MTCRIPVRSACRAGLLLFATALLPDTLLAQEKPSAAPFAPVLQLSAPEPNGSDGSAKPRPGGSGEVSVLVVAGEETTLSSQMSGRIKSIPVGLGDDVKAGRLLLEFDCGEGEAQLKAAQAEFRGARDTHLTKLRLQALGAAGELEVSVAAAAADKLNSQISLREAQLAYCKVRAPFNGRIAKLRVKTAESVPVGHPLIDMVNSQSVKAQLFVPAAWIRHLKTGTAFTVRTSHDGREYEAIVSKLNVRVEGVSQTLELEARFGGDTQYLLPGMVGTARFPDMPRE